jgi:hypothetical protein
MEWETFGKSEAGISDEMKHQIPSTKLQRNIKQRSSKSRAATLMFGACCFSGAWCLGLGVFL